MNLTPLTPLLVGLALTGITALGARGRHQIVGDCQIFRFPAAIAYLMFGIALFFVGVPFLPGAAGNMDFLTFASVPWGFAMSAVAFAGYLLKYRVMIDGDHVSTGAYFKREFSTHDIVAVKMKKGSRSAELIVLLRNGRKVTFSGMLSDFDSLATLMTGCSGNGSAS